MSSHGSAAGVVAVRRRDRGSSPGSVCRMGAEPVRGSDALGSAPPVGWICAEWRAASVSGTEVESSAATVPTASGALIVCLRASGSAVSIGGLGAAVAGEPFGRSLRGAAAVDRAVASSLRKWVDSPAISDAGAAGESIVASLCWAIDGGCGVPLVSVPPMYPASMGERCPPSAGKGPRSSGMSIWRRRSASAVCAAVAGGASAAAGVHSGSGVGGLSGVVVELGVGGLSGVVVESGVGGLSGVDAESGAEAISRCGADVPAESVGGAGCASLVCRIGSSWATWRGGAVSGWSALSRSRMSGESVWAEAEAPARSVCRIGE